MAENQDIMQMTPEDLQALRDQADVVGLADVELGKFLKLLIPLVAHAYGLDPAQEDAKARDAQNQLQEDTRKQEADAWVQAGNELSPAQEENKAQAEAQGADYVPSVNGVEETLDPAALANQAQGAVVVPSAQANEVLPDALPPNTLPGAVSTYTDFSSSTSVAAEDASAQGQSDGGKEQ